MFYLKIWNLFNTLPVTVSQHHHNTSNVNTMPKSQEFRRLLESQIYITLDDWVIRAFSRTVRALLDDNISRWLKEDKYKSTYIILAIYICAERT